MIPIPRPVLGLLGALSVAIAGAVLATSAVEGADGADDLKAWQFSVLSETEARRLPGAQNKPELPPQTLFYQPRTTYLWDTWMVHHEGRHYLYYLNMHDTPGGWHGAGVAMAVSSDGVHWKELGLVLPKAAGAVGFGTGSIWKSETFAKDGRFIMNHSEWFDTPINSQFIRFAESTDLIHWKRLGADSDFRAEPRWYETYPQFKSARWDCIYTIPRPGGGRLGYWTANPLTGAGFGFGESLDGIHWKALQPPKIEWGDVPVPHNCEAGAVEKIGDKYYLLLGGSGSMRTLVADRPQGPFRPAKKNYQVLGGHTYFARFFPTPGGLLVNHHSIPRTPKACRMSPLKVAQVDSEGTLRLVYWPGNEKAKRETVAMKWPSDATDNGSVAMLMPKLDAQNGFILEGTLALGTASSGRNGLYVEFEPSRGTAIISRAHGVTELGTMRRDGRDFRPEMRIDRNMDFGPTPRFRLLVKHSLLEFYLNDVLIQCYSLPADATGRVGVIGATVPTK